jgi:predicted permease
MEAFERILGIILPVFAIIAVGYIYARLRGETVRTDMAAANRLSMEILSPLLVFSALAAKDFDVGHNALLMLAGVLIALGSGLIAWPVARLLGYDVRSFVPPMMYNNCGNMGLPLAVMAFGPSGLSQAAALFMACNVVYFTLGIRIIETGHAERRTAFLQFFMSPIMLSMIVGFAFSLLHIHLPAPLFEGLRLLGGASIPLMLFALGVRMLDVNFRSWHIGLVGAIVCPLAGLAVAWLLDQVLHLTPVQRGQMYLFASLPPAVFCFLIAEQYQQEPDKVASIVLIGNLAAVLFVPAGLWFGLR